MSDDALLCPCMIRCVMRQYTNPFKRELKLQISLNLEVNSLGD